MAQVQYKFDAARSASDVTATAQPFSLSSVHAFSPARAMQEDLLARTVQTDRWPIARRIAFIASITLALWAAIIQGAVSVIHAVA